MEAKDVSKWTETLKAEETLWHHEMEQITLKKCVYVVKYPDVETKLGPLNECPDSNWSVITLKNLQTYLVDVIVKNFAFVSVDFLVVQPSTTQSRWTVF